MSNIKYWQDKIREKRKNTNFKDFLKDFGSWYPIVFNKNNGFISRYPESNRVSVYSIKEFENDRNELTNKGLDYDFGIGFFKNFEILFKKTKLPNFVTYNTNSNCDYVDSPAGVSNSYLSSVVVLGSENIFYSNVVRSNVYNCFNSLYVIENSENIYFSVGIITSFNVFYSSYIKNCSDVWFSSNLSGCKNCIFCNDLENCSYYIENKKYDKIEYFKKKDEILKEKNNYLSWYKLLNKKGKNHGSINSFGNFILDSEGIQSSSFIFNTKNAKNVLFAGAIVGNSNIFDSITCGGGGGDDLYGVINSGGGPTNLYSVAHSGWCSNCYNCFLIENCNHCIGCIGLKNKSYCILNTQYTKEKWEIKAEKIFFHMEKDGILGDFFPGYMCPFYFNDSLAGLIGNYNKDEVLKNGYMWREGIIKIDIPEGSDVIKYTDLVDYEGYNQKGNWVINKEILNKVIVGENGNYYKIVQTEYNFLVKYGLPIPKIHWLDRMKLNFGV